CYRVQFVDQNDEQALRAALAEKPKLVLVESPSNPLLAGGGYCENLWSGA
ncbi:cystathionine gamma-synthase (CGS) (O-succinylhomoserine(thiol)-lyase), partial [Escherichia coli M056]